MKKLSKIDKLIINSPYEVERNSETDLLNELLLLIENSKQQFAMQANSAVTLLFWHIGKRINEHILKNQRAEYGKQIVSTVSTQLVEKYGRNFELRNVRRMMQFAEQFTDIEIVIPLARQMSWSHFIELLPIKTMQSKLFYANLAVSGNLGVRELRNAIAEKTYERIEIANLQIIHNEFIPQNTFKDPYFLNFIELKDGYLEKDLEAAILRELESFILEIGKGFAFVERQKRMIIDDEDFKLDLLFYNRNLRRLVAIELKLGKFKAQHLTSKFTNRI